MLSRPSLKIYISTHRISVCLNFKPVSMIKSKNREVESRSMCATREAWVVATSVGVVEAMKDQGYCRWNNAVRSVHQHAKTKLRSTACQATKLSAGPSSPAVSNDLRHDEVKKAEESLRTVMFLITWGPNS